MPWEFESHAKHQAQQNLNEIRAFRPSRESLSKQVHVKLALAAPSKAFGKAAV
jgi:hypothetical protein